MMYVVYIADRGYGNNNLTWVVDTQLSPEELKTKVQAKLTADEYDDHYVRMIKPLEEVVKKF